MNNVACQLGAIKTVSGPGELISFTNRHQRQLETLSQQPETPVGSAKALQYLLADNIS